MDYTYISGVTPSVITAIMKQQTTERARTILNHGMDIYSGSGICIGENNFFTKFYNSSPVGITVEGSNTLTRGLIIFGQGLNKSHPYIFPIFQSIQDDDLDGFKQHFNSLVVSSVGNYVKLLFSPFSRLNRLELATLKFSVLSNFVAIMGGKIKSKQMISGNMSDVLSNLYLSHAVVWYHLHHFTPVALRDKCLDYLLDEAEHKMNLVVANYPVQAIKFLLRPLTSRTTYPVFEKNNELYKIILNSKDLHTLFKSDIYYKGTVIEKMENLRNMTPNTPEYNELYQDIISVGEFKNETA
jgi:acyl-CoA dehydrogenase